MQEALSAFAPWVVLALLGVAIALFIWEKWRYDLVALMCLLAAVLLGLVPAEQAFAGFGHPAVITVAAVLILSRALQQSGVIDILADRVSRSVGSAQMQLAALCLIGAALSAFMNNVGALALLMPIMIAAGQRGGPSPSQGLMPLSFSAILGGLVTLIGTPPNLIVSGYRQEAVGAPFSMFDFAPVGLALALAGVLFVTICGRWLIPQNRRGQSDTETTPLFEIGDYVAEFTVGEDSALIGTSVQEVERRSEATVQVLGLVRQDRKLFNRMRLELIQPGDVLILQGSTDDLQKLVGGDKGLAPLGRTDLAGDGKPNADAAFLEAVVMPGTRLEGRSVVDLRVRQRLGVTLVALSRSGQTVPGRLHEARLHTGDVLLLEGAEADLADAVQTLGLLPLAQRGIAFRTRRALVPLALFGAAVLSVSFGLASPAIALMLAAIGMVLTRILSLRQAYQALDLPVLVLLGAMIPVGDAMQSTGASELLVNAILAVAGDAQPWVLMALLLIVTMFLSDVMNNAATAVVMSPIAVAIAISLNLSPDPFLMAVAIGASSAFLTPIGHQNNTLVMGPGGYRFGDYWKLGLPLEAILVAIAVPLIPLIFPF